MFIVMTLFVTLSGHQKRTHTTWHSLHQGPYISQAHSPHLVGCTPRFWSSGRRIIHVSDPDPRLAPNMLSGVHVRTLCWPVHDIQILLPQKSIGAMRCAGHGIVLDIHKVSSKTPVALGSIPSWRSLMWHWRLRVPSSTTSSLLSWWIALHTMTEGPWLPSIGWMHALIGPSPCLQHTRAWPPQWNVKRDSSLKTQCLHCLRSHPLCILPHICLYRPWPKVNLGHLAGCLD